MEATPSTYAADIAHTLRHFCLIDHGIYEGETPEEVQARRARLVEQLAHLERNLARAEALWAKHGTATKED